MPDRIFIGGGGKAQAEAQHLLLEMANRHGLIAGATGTGKTVTLQILTEGFSAAGVPVILSDVKGDLSGLAKAGSARSKHHDVFQKRAKTIGFDLNYSAFPVTFWDLFGSQGHPIRTTISEIGPLLLSRLLDLTDAQEGALNVAFRLADDEGLPLLDLQDLRTLLTYIGETEKNVTLRYGSVATRSIGAIQRQLLVLENQGAAAFFGEPALDLNDLMRVDAEGRGVVNILAADRLMTAPRLYATFLLWLLSELFEELPEVGNPKIPKLVFFFDEAHLLFDDAPKALIDKVEQVARLIRSKGVGVYFVTQNPADVPEDVLSQLGNRVQHALRAFTANDQRDLRKAADTYRANPGFDTAEAIRDVGTGEAVTSMLERKGVPGVVERTLIRPPSSQLGPITSAERATIIETSSIAGKYEHAIDRMSASEILSRRAESAAIEAEAAEATRESEFSHARRYDGGQSPRRRTRDDDSFGEALGKMVINELTGTTGRRIVRGVLGSLFKGR